MAVLLRYERILETNNTDDNETDVSVEFGAGAAKVASSPEFIVGMSIVLLALVIGFVVHSSKSRRSHKLSSKKAAAAAPMPVDWPHSDISFRISTKLFGMYYRNERNNIQCFPDCKEWGEYSIGRQAGLEHQHFKRGECSDTVEATLVVPAHFAGSICTIARISANTLEPDLGQGWECGSDFLEDLLAKDYMLGVLRRKGRLQGDKMELQVSFLSIPQWKFEGRIGQRIELFVEVYVLRSSSWNPLYRLDLPWLIPGSYLPSSEVFAQSSAGKVGDGGEIHLNKLSDTDLLLHDATSGELLDDDTLHMLAGDTDFLSLDLAGHTSDGGDTSMSGSSKEQNRHFDGKGYLHDTVSSNASQQPMFTVMARYVSSTFVCGTTKSLKVSKKDTATKKPKSRKNKVKKENSQVTASKPADQVL